MNAADVLERAADVIVERGWCQDTAVTEEGAVCVTGALAVAELSPSPWELQNLGAAAGMRLAEHVGLENRRRDLTCLVRWNDKPDRTADEVIVALRECAASLRAES